MHRASWYTIVFAGLALVAACSNPSGLATPDVLLLPNKAVYAPGETISADLVNRSTVEVGYGACSLRLERFVGTQWALVGPPHLPCISILYVIGPGSTTMLSLPLAGSLEPGTYRLRHEILPRTEPPAVHIRSGEIRVEPGPS